MPRALLTSVLTVAFLLSGSVFAAAHSDSTSLTTDQNSGAMPSNEPQHTDMNKMDTNGDVTHDDTMHNDTMRQDDMMQQDSLSPSDTMQQKSESDTLQPQRMPTDN